MRIRAESDAHSRWFPRRRRESERGTAKRSARSGSARSGAILAIVAAVMLVATSLAVAHGPPPPVTYDPLTFQVNTWLTSNFALTRTRNPAEGALALDPTPPGGASPSYVWKIQIPFGFAPRQAFTYRLFFRLDAPGLPQDPSSSKSVGVGIAKNGKLVDGSLQRLAFPIDQNNIPTPGSIYAFTGGVAASGVTFTRNDTIGLYLVNYNPGASSDMSLLWGGTKYNSTFDLEAITASSIDEMQYENAGYPHFLLENFLFQPPGESTRVLAIDVHHDFVFWNDTTVPAGTRVFLEFRGSEPPLDATTYHHFVEKDRRDAAAHGFNVDSENRPFSLYPGEVVIVPLGNLTKAGNITITCTQNCPIPGWKGTLTVLGAGGAAGGNASTSTANDPPTKKAPDVAAPLELGALLVAAVGLARLRLASRRGAR
ncbi:MAG: hypothetical protein ACYDCK_09440 [Thermoplasmatota archaeon]